LIHQSTEALGRRDGKRGKGIISFTARGKSNYVYAAYMMLLAAKSMSASSHTTTGAFPPSSKVTGFKLAAQV